MIGDSHDGYYVFVGKMVQYIKWKVVTKIKNRRYKGRGGID